jgi:hypothetical protein
MTDGIEGLLDVQELLNRLAKQETLIEEQAKLLDGYEEATEKLIRAHSDKDASDRKSDKKIDALWEEAIEMTGELVKKYCEVRDKQLAGTRAGQERAKKLYPEALKIYRQELPRAASKKEARERTQAKLVKMYSDYRKDGRIWKDSYFRQLIEKLMK